jgi:hypothetical protein
LEYRLEAVGRSREEVHGSGPTSPSSRSSPPVSSEFPQLPSGQSDLTCMLGESLGR